LLGLGQLEIVPGGNFFEIYAEFTDIVSTDLNSGPAGSNGIAGFQFNMNQLIGIAGGRQF